MSGVPILGDLVGGKKKPKVVQAAPVPTPSDPDAADKLAAAAEAERRIRGRASTILTGGAGLSGNAATARVLLGDGGTRLL